MGKSWPTLSGTQVIGITGAARHGKDELAKALVRLIPGAERWALSDAVATVARFSGQMLQRDAGLMQSIGTSGREVDAAIWLKCCYWALVDRAPPVAVITGIRYQNEADFIAELGGTLVGLVRLNAPPIVDRDPLHSVEQEIPQLLDQARVRLEVENILDDTERAQYFDVQARIVASRIWGSEWDDEYSSDTPWAV